MSRNLKSTSSIAKRLHIPPKRLFAILEKHQWIKREESSWVLTSLGIDKGGVIKEHSDPAKGTYIVWPVKTVYEIEKLATDLEQSLVQPSSPHFREKLRLRAKYRTQDGHYVRSKAEVIIDNWLHYAGITHVYERKLPINEEAYCDFYLPDADVYIEYWGLTHREKYARRRLEKLAIYARHKLKHIELTEEDVKNLDDCLPPKLLAYDIIVTNRHAEPTVSSGKSFLSAIISNLFSRKPR